MARTMTLAPRINQAGMPGFLLWARRDNPALYDALLRKFPAVNEFEQAFRQDQGMQGFADILKSVGSSLASSAKSISAFVVNNALPIATAAVPIVVAKKQADVAKAQLQLAQAQQPPMQTAYQYDANGNAYAVPVRQTLSAGAEETLREAGMINTPIQNMNQARGYFSWSTQAMGVPLWGWAAAAGLGLVLLLRRR